MSDTDAKYLEMFPAWLRTLGEDAAALGEVVSGGASEQVKRHAIAGLNYIFKSLDLIPDGIDDLGFMDDAFVLRVASELAVNTDPAGNTGIVGKLAQDSAEVSAFFDPHSTPLQTYFQSLHKVHT